MTEQLTIHREWTPGYSATKTYSLTFLLGLKELLDLDDVSSDGDEFTEFITGLNCDSYADLSCDIMKYTYDDFDYEDFDKETKLDNCFRRCMDDDEFLTCYTVFRLWNSGLTTADALDAWRESCLTTLEGMLDA